MALPRSCGGPNHLRVGMLAILLLSTSFPLAAQNASPASIPVPPLVPYSGLVVDGSGKALTSPVTITFLIFKDETGGEPLFVETQSVAVDATGHYKVNLGATLASGLPTELFATGAARWLEVQVAGEAPQARVMLVSVPYALKAADASTLGGLPASAFALSGRTSSLVAPDLSPAVVPSTNSTVTTPGGATGYVPIFTGASTIGNSNIFQNTSTNSIGINGTPYATLDVYGNAVVRGIFQMLRTGNATAAAGANSYAYSFHPQVYNSGGFVVNPNFTWQAEPVGNNTTKPSATLNLLMNNGLMGQPAETGFYFNLNGTMHFAPGQTFPGGTGTGTITGVTAGTALTGGGTSGNVTLNLDTTKVPLLSASNYFIGTQTVVGNLSVSSTVSAGIVNANYGIELGGIGFASGSFANGNVNLGYAGNVSMSGFGNTATGRDALASDTTGSSNTATGGGALYSNTTGIYNTASGASSLASNTTGSNNTASGDQALTSNTMGSNNTASGYLALSSNNAGNSNTASGTYALSTNTTGDVNTASGTYALSANTTGSGNTASGDQALESNTTGSFNVGIGINAGGNLDFSNGTGSFNTAVGTDTAFSTGSITNATAIGAYAEVDQSNTLVLGCTAGENNCPAAVSVGIGTTTPDNLLTVNGSADKPGGGSWGTYSDGRLKTVNGSFGSGLDQVIQLHPIRYRYKPDNGMGIRDADEHIGVVAQEVQRVIPEAVTENGKGYLLVNNDPILWSMVNAIKEQQHEIERQQKLLLAQTAINEEQGKLLRAQSAAMRSLAAEVRETRKMLRQVRAQAAAGQLTMVAAK